jgi:tetratricopeptide (TPR) repeat protein
MATKAKRKPTPDQPLPTAPRSDLADMAERIAENPLVYVGAILFVLVAGIAGWLITVYNASANQEFATAYARAFESGENTEILAALEPLAKEDAGPSHEALYMLGELAYESGDYAKAKEAFTELRERHEDSPFVPDAVEGLGFIAEAEGNYVDAKAHYQDVMDSWPDSFAAKRQQLNIGRCEEAIGNPEAAIEAYRAQTMAFPNSRAAARANSMMTQLQEEIGPEESELESALGAVLETTAAEETAEPEAPEGAAEEADTESVPVVDTEAMEAPIEAQELELRLPQPGEGQGAETQEMETAPEP